MNQATPKWAQLLELGTGLLGCAIGVSWFGYRLLIGIPGVRTTVDPTSGSSSAVITSQPLTSFGLGAVVAVSLMLLAAMGVGIGSCIHIQQGDRQGAWLLWLSTAVLVVGTVFLIFGLGLILATVALLALVASLTGIWVQIRSAP